MCSLSEFSIRTYALPVELAELSINFLNKSHIVLDLTIYIKLDWPVAILTET